LQHRAQCEISSKCRCEVYLEGAPELILEIAGSSVSYDVHDTLEVYRRHGVREYLENVKQSTKIIDKTVKGDLILKLVRKNYIKRFSG